jgi:hypothetical protein
MMAGNHFLCLLEEPGANIFNQEQAGRQPFPFLDEDKKEEGK